MDPPYTPYSELPENPRIEMQLLQRYKDRVTTQAHQVADVALSEWEKADIRAAAHTAAPTQAEQQATDRAVCVQLQYARRKPRKRYRLCKYVRIYGVIEIGALQDAG